MSVFNALVICNHGPPGPGNSGDFDFWASKSLLKAPLCGDCSLVKPLLFSPAACYRFISWPFCLYKANPGISPALPWLNFGQIPAHFHGYPPPLPRPGGVVNKHRKTEIALIKIKKPLNVHFSLRKCLNVQCALIILHKATCDISTGFHLLRSM